VCRKSQVAIEYAYRAKQVLPQLTVLWIHASTPARFEQGYRDFARKADIPGQDDPALHILELVRDWLSDLKYGQWLMVLDNVDNGDDWFLPRPTLDNYGQKQRPLEVFLPQSPNGTIIVTSRNSTTASHLLGNYGNSISIKCMPESDALALLGRKVSFDQTSEKDARALVHALEGIPLAITQAAAYINTRERVDVSKYFELFQESEINMAVLLNNEDTKQDLRRDYSTRLPILRTWQITINSIHETLPQSADLLALMSMFDRQQIPKCLLDAGLSSLQFEENIAPLLRYSLIHQQTRENDFGMHRLVQLATKTWLQTSNGFSKWKSEALKIMANIIPVDPVFKNWPLCQDLLPHAKELVANNKADVSPEDASNIATILKASGWYLMERIGEYKGAEKNMRDAFIICEQVLGLEHQLTIDCLGALSSAHRVQGELIQAEAMARQALQLSERATGPNSLDTTKAQFRLGLLLIRKKDHGEVVYEEAELRLRQALTTWKEKLGWKNSKTLFAAANLALILAYQRKYEEAEPMIRRAMENMELILGKEHADTMIHRNILPGILEDQQKYAEAEEIYKRNLEIRERVMGPNHPRTLGTIRRLVGVLEKQGKHGEARPWKPKATEAVRKGYFDSA
jgi:tetratricopeptide (TPR) repeat protein